jgi:hypothetical protein
MTHSLHHCSGRKNLGYVRQSFTLPATRQEAYNEPEISKEALMNKSFRLKSIRIENFRWIDSLEISFSVAGRDLLDPIYLAGDNGVCKTAVLEAILSLLHYRAGYCISGSTGLENLIHFGASKMSITGELEVNLGSSQDPFTLSYEVTQEHLKHDAFSSIEPRWVRVPFLT